MIGHVIQGMNEVITNDYSTSHKALDIVASNNGDSDIISLENGTVTVAVKDVKGTNHYSKGLDTYGNYVKVKQDNGKTALYAHMKYGSVKVSEGQYVQKGDIIGSMGATGNAYGKHLHLEIKNENNVNENPIDSLNSVSEVSSSNQVQNNDSVQSNETIQNNETIQGNESVYNTQNNDSVSNNDQLSDDVKENVEVSESFNNGSFEYLSAREYRGGSIVDGLKFCGCESSFTYREKLALKNGIDDYHGSYSQNVKLLKLLKEGKLKKAI